MLVQLDNIEIQSKEYLDVFHHTKYNCSNAGMFHKSLAFEGAYGTVRTASSGVGPGHFGG